MKGNQDIRN